MRARPLCWPTAPVWAGSTVFIQRGASPIPAEGDSTRDAPSVPAEAIGEHAGLDAVMARAGGENFPVALRTLPAPLRRHLLAVYGYARLIDNLGNEYPGDRSAALDWVDAQLDDLFAGTPDHPIFRQLAPTVAHFDLPRTPFDALLAANRLDQHKHRYATWDELLEYCALSANPVGHLVLAVFGSATAERLAASDAVCSGLQVLEHLQDLGEDAAAGCVYMPAEDMERFGCTTDDLLAPVAGTGVRDLVAYEAGRAREMLETGRALVASMRGYGRLAVAGFVAGGLAGLDAVEGARFEVLSTTRQAGTVRLLRRLVPVYLGAMVRRGNTP